MEATTPPPPCWHLRNKKMYVPGQASEAFVETQEPGSGVAAQCWCNITMMEVGADDGLVSVSRCCNPSRSCYQAL